MPFPPLDHIVNPLVDPPVSGLTPSVFIERADYMTSTAWPLTFSRINGFTDQVNVVGTWISDAIVQVESISGMIFASGNMLGDWNTLSGPATVPTIVRHNNNYWILMQDMAEVSAVEPGTDEEYWRWHYDVTGGITVDLTTLFLAWEAVATPAEYMSNTADRVIGVTQTWEAAVPVGLTPGATITIDMNTGSNFHVTIGQNTTINATNAKPGQPVAIDLTNSGTYSVSFGTEFVFRSAIAPSLNVAGRHYLTGTVLHDGKILIGVGAGSIG